MHDGVVEGLAGGSGGSDVDDKIPEALQGEHESGGVIEAEVYGFGVREGVDAVHC